MKKILLHLFVFVLLFVSACGAINEPIGSQAPNQPTQTPVVIVVTATPALTESATAILPTASSIPTFTPMPVAPQVNVACDKHGTVAWQNDNQADGSVYGEAPVGGLDEPCWVVGQTWWIDANGTSHRAVFAVAPHTVAWLSGHKGGTGWYFGGSLADVKANLAEQFRQLLERDGEMDTLTIILPDDAVKFPILTRFSQKQ